jgi:hypothetical protein
MFFMEFPNNFAMRVAEPVGLLDVHVTESSEFDAKYLLGEFQHFSLLSDYEEALQAYHMNLEKDTELTEEQLTALRVIHAATRPWVLGRAMATIMRRLSSDKEALRAAEMILNKLYVNGDVNENEVNKLVFTLTKDQKI